MKKLILTALISALAFQGNAQDVAPIEKAREIANLITSKTGKLPNAPFAMELDLEQPQFLGKDSHGGIVIPVKGLVHEQIAKAGKDVVPVGMVWFRNLIPADGPVAKPDGEGIRNVEISDGKKVATIHPFFAGIRKNTQDRLELVLYGKSNKEPFVRSWVLPMPSRQELPIELAAYGGDDSGAILVMSFLGKYQAEIRIVPHETPDEYVGTSATTTNGPDNKAAEAAHLLSKHLNKFKAQHVKIEADLNNANLFKKNDIAALIVPDKGLSSDRLAKTGENEVPVGQLWLQRIAPEVDGAEAAESALNYIEIQEQEKPVKLPQFLLTAQRKGKNLNLLIYSADKEPLTTMPLKRFETRQSLPIELEGEPRDESSGILSLYVLGEYHAKIVVRPH